MKRMMASIQVIGDVNPIFVKDNDGIEQQAKNIERIQVLGWTLVAQRDQFKIGDKCVFVEPDAVLPEREEFEFLRKCCYINKNGFTGFLIGTSRRLGVISQGIAFPLSILPEGTWEVGQDVSEVLGIVKYDPPVPACIGGMAKGKFPWFIPQTDEFRIHSVPDVLLRHKGESVYATLKMDGSSTTYYVKDGIFGVCSRNIELQDTPTNSMWSVARQYDLERKMLELSKVIGDIAIQGELVGPSINKNRHGFKVPDIYAFSVYSIEKNKYLDILDARNIVLGLGLKFVPILKEAFVLDHSIRDLEEMASGPDMFNPAKLMEGIVVRPVVEGTDIQTGRFSFKVLPPKSLL